MLIFGETFRFRQGIAIMLAMAGLALMVLDQAESGGLLAFGLILLAALCGTAGNNILKSLDQVGMLGVAVWMSLAAPLPLLLLSLIFESHGPVQSLITSVSWATVGAVAYSAILATVLVFAIWGRLLATHPAASVAPFFLLVPVFGIGLSTLLLGELLTFGQICGAILIFIDLAVATWHTRTDAAAVRWIDADLTVVRQVGRRSINASTHAFLDELKATMLDTLRSAKQHRS